MEAQRFKSALSKITQGIVFSEKSIFQSVDVSSEVHTTKKSVTYTVMIQPVLKNNSIGHVRETILMYSKNWTVDMMKKEILDVLKRDSYDFIKNRAENPIRRSDNISCQAVGWGRMRVRLYRIVSAFFYFRFRFVYFLFGLSGFSIPCSLIYSSNVSMLAPPVVDRK